MSRIPLITERDGLDERRTVVFDAVVESRGSIIRPYQVLLHAPGIALPAAELGGQIRYHGSLPDQHRELAILTTARICVCQFEWDSHVDTARSAGVSPGAITHLMGESGEASPEEALIIAFVRELSNHRTVTDEMFTQIKTLVGDEGVVELATLVGYYTLLGYVMNVADIC
jgi:4-carboxymuconolactone decarboxylase